MSILTFTMFPCIVIVLSYSYIHFILHMISFYNKFFSRNFTRFIDFSIIWLSAHIFYFITFIRLYTETVPREKGLRFLVYDREITTHVGVSTCPLTFPFISSLRPCCLCSFTRLTQWLDRCRSTVQFTNQNGLVSPLFSSIK